MKSLPIYKMPDELTEEGQYSVCLSDLQPLWIRTHVPFIDPTEDWYYIVKNGISYLPKILREVVLSQGIICVAILSYAEEWKESYPPSWSKNSVYGTIPFLRIFLTRNEELLIEAKPSDDGLYPIRDSKHSFYEINVEGNERAYSALNLKGDAFPGCEFIECNFGCDDVLTFVDYGGINALFKELIVN